MKKASSSLLSLVYRNWTFSSPVRFRPAITHTHRQLHVRWIKELLPLKYLPMTAKLSTYPVKPRKNEPYNQDKTFPENENTYVRHVFTNWPEYQATIINEKAMESLNWASLPPVVKQVRERSINPTPLSIMDSSFSDLRKLIIDEISTLNDDELFALLYSLGPLVVGLKVNDPDFKNFWQVLDEECVKRRQGWDFDTLFLVDDLLQHLRIARSSSFHYILLKKLFRKMDRLDKVKFVRFMYAINLSRQAPAFMSAFELQHGLKQYVNELRPEEVALVAIALFKSENKIQDMKLLEMMALKIMSGSETMTSVLVGGFAKFLRFSSKSEIGDTVYNFQDKFLPEVERLDVPGTLQLSLVGTTTLNFHKGLVEAVKNKIEKKIEETRIKEIERLLLVLTMFDFNCTSFYEKVVAEIQKEERVYEISIFGRSLPAILYYLSLRGIFIYNLIDEALSREFLLKHFGRNMAKYERELLCLDFNVGFQCPDYKGTRLSEQMCEKISKFYLLYTNPMHKTRVSGHQANLKEMITLATSILGGEKYAYLCNILPQYYTAELVFCLDKNNQPVEVPEQFRSIPAYAIKWIPAEHSNLSFHAIFLCNRNSCAFGTNNLLGQSIVHEKHLRKMGYNLHMILPLDWLNCEAFAERQQSLLMEQIFNKVLSENQLKSLGMSQ